MSNPANQTRQQLEELDALLQRMLSLPINQTGETPPPGPRPAMQPEPTYAPPPMPRMPPPAPPMPQRRAEPPHGANAWQIPLPPNAGASVGIWPMGVEALNSSATSSVTPAPAPPPPAAYGRLNVATIPSPDEANRSREAPPMMARPSVAAVPMLPPPIAEAPLPFYLWPFGLVDRSMGGALAAFGPVGRWFGQGGGKVVVGWAGMLMLIAAAAWAVMDYMGWSW
jgi:hypothetical protein